MTEYFTIPATCGITDSAALADFPVPAAGIPFSFTGTLTDGLLTTLSPFGTRPSIPLQDDANRRTFARLTEELNAYFAGELTAFSIPLATAGTDYQKSVWAALRQIPYG